MPNDADAHISGYPLLDDGTLFPGGRAFTTHHPETKSPLVLKRYRGEWLLPSDSIDNFQTRAHAAIAIRHPNLLPLHDAGFIGSDVFAVVEPFAGESLETLVKDIGAMPAFLACEFVKQAALALSSAHDVGMVHGDLGPWNLVVGPLVDSSKTRADGTTIQRPATNAAAKLANLGLIPTRPSGREWAGIDPLARFSLGFLPPERVDNGTTSVATDVYGLGATLFYLLAARPPFVAPSAADVVNAIANTAPAPLNTLRPDLPAGLADVVMAMLAKDPASRPSSAKIVADKLTAFTEPEPVALTAAPPEAVAPAAWNVAEVSGPASETDHVLQPATDHHDAFASAHSEAAAEPQEPKKKSTMSEDERAKLRMWLYLGGFFWFVLVPILWLVLLSDSGCFSSKKSEPEKKQDTTPTRRKRG